VSEPFVLGPGEQHADCRPASPRSRRCGRRSTAMRSRSAARPEA